MSDAGQDGTQAKELARNFEDEIFKKSTTIAEYHESLAKLIRHIQPKKPAQDETEKLSADPHEVLNPEGPTMGHYQFATFHADGRTSTVYKAQDKSWIAPSRIVALKVTHPASMTAPHNSKREARLLAQCHHERVVPLLETFSQSGGEFVLVFPFLRQDLENLLRSENITARQKSMVFTGLFEALAHIHGLGIIHRDVKPSNILLQSMDGPVYLIDFGIAWSQHDPDSEPAGRKITDVGTTCYRPPELLFGDTSYGTTLDIWAAGCIVGELVKDDHRAIFDSGPLGSELGLIKSMFTTLGTPTDETWPSAASYPDWDKMTFAEFPAQPWNGILPGASKSATDFVSKTVCFEPTKRLTATEALRHPLKSELNVGR